MILHPGILALLAGSAIVLAMLLYASVLGWGIARRWDFGSSSEEQLAREQKTLLVSTLAQCAIAFEVFSGLIFLYTAEEIHPLFAGAMCATGTLNAHPTGWQVLGMKMAVFFAGALWMIVNGLDQRAVDYPLVRKKYILLPGLTLLVALDLALQLQFFLGLQPEIITSCCGSLFSTAGTGAAADLAALPAGPAMVTFYLAAALLVGLLLLCLRTKGGLPRLALSAAAGGWFLVALASVISFISPYIYEIPTHHCPFDFLQRAYGYFGYPFYIALFAGVLGGLVPGILHPLRRFPSLREEIALTDRRWLLRSLLLTLVFLAMASWPVLFGRLSLLGY